MVYLLTYLKKIMILLPIVIIPTLFHTGCGSCGSDNIDGDGEVSENLVALEFAVSKEDIILRSDVTALKSEHLLMTQDEAESSLEISSNGLITRTDIVNPVPTPTDEFFKSEVTVVDDLALVGCALPTKGNQQYCGLCKPPTDGIFNCKVEVPANIELSIDCSVLYKNTDDSVTFVRIYDFTMNVSTANISGTKPKIKIETFTYTYNVCEPSTSEVQHQSLVEKDNSSSTAKSGSWILLNPTIDEGTVIIGRKDFDAIEKDKFVYIMGGEGDKTDFNDVVACDMNSEPPVCNVVSSMALPITGCTSVATVDSALYTVKNDTTNYTYKALYKYDLSLGSATSWQLLSQLPQTHGYRICPQITAYDKKIYVLGGYPTGAPTIDDISTFDLNLGTWQDFNNPEKVTRGFCSATAVDENGNDKIYLIGGLVTNATFSNSIQIIDPLTNDIEALDILPAGVSDCTCISWNNTIYYFGSKEDGSRVSGTFDPVTLSVGEFPSSLPPIFSEQRATLVDGIMYLFGGVTKNNTYLDIIVKYYL